MEKTKGIFVYLTLFLCYVTLIQAIDVKFHWDDDLLRHGTKTNWTWSKVEDLLKQLMDGFLAPNLLTLLRVSSEMNFTKPCQKALISFALDLRNLESWAVRMLDASGKIPSGILDGTVMDFGSFDECLGIRVNSSDGIRGKYCMISYSSPLITPLSSKTASGRSYVEQYGDPPQWIADSLSKGGGFLKKVAFFFGTCVPSTCTQEDIRKIATIVSKPLGFEVSIEDCQTDEYRKFEKYEIISICLLGSLAILSFVGSIADGFSYLNSKRTNQNLKPYRRESILLQIIKSFSLASNTKRLLQSGGGSGTLPFFNGVRLFSATWIILGHTYFFVDTWKYLKYRHLIGVTEQFDKHLPAAVIENFTIPVGSFFFMSGCLLTYTNWHKMEKNEGKLNLLHFFVHKFCRMTPALGLTLLLLFVLPLIDSGPLWYTTLKPQIDVCREHWWKNLIYINNWWDVNNICLIHTWYLAALMQFHLFAVLLLCATFRWPLLGSLTGLLILLAGCVVTALRMIWQNFPMPAPGMIRDLDVINDYNSDVYVKPYAHVASYLIGMVAGFVLLKYRHVKLCLAYQTLGWVIAVICGLCSVYGIYGPSEAIAVRAIYVSLHRIGWAVALSWLTFSCATHSAGFVGRLLSWKALQPLGQLSYLAYLLHPLVVIYRNASLKERVYYGHTELVFAYFANVVVGFFLAYVCYIAVEMPFSTAEAILLSRTKETKLKNGCQTKDVSGVTTIAVTPNNVEL